MSKDEQKLTRAGLSRALDHLDAMESISAEELFERLGIMTNQKEFTGLIHSLWKMVISEAKMEIHSDILKLDGEG